jgi:uncharacterized membrane protein
MTTEIVQQTREEKMRSISLYLQQTLQNAGQIESTVKTRLEDPDLSPKSKAGLRQILRTAHRLQRTLKQR